MKILVRPSKCKGRITANPSKSYMQRALALTGLSGRPVIIHHPCQSADSMAALSVVGNMGYRHQFAGSDLHLSPSPQCFSPEWNVGESGLSARMFSIIAGMYDQKIRLSGCGSLLGRPLNQSVAILEQMGVQVASDNGFLPFEIRGPVRHSDIVLDASDSSQVLSGLLIALPFMSTDSSITVQNIKSKPYVQLTLEMLKQFGITVEVIDFKHFKIPGNQQINIDSFQIEGDWSGAAFALVAGALNGRVQVDGLREKSVQGDSKIADILVRCGTICEWAEGGIKATKQDLRAFEYNADDTPDLFPPLVALAAHCRGTSRIDGVARLIHKESNRFLALQKEFGKLNINIEKLGNTMLVHGGKMCGGHVISHHDHRIAMALLVAATGADSPVTIEGMECVHKSYPDFLKDMSLLNIAYDVLEP